MEDAPPTDLGGQEGVVAGYGPYRLVVAFDPLSGEPAGVVAERSDSDAVYTRKWQGLESLPRPESVVRRLARQDKPS